MQPTATMATAATTSTTVALTTTWDNATGRPTGEPDPVLDNYMLLVVVMALFVGGTLVVLSGTLLLCRRCWEVHRRVHRATEEAEKTTTSYLDNGARPAQDPEFRGEEPEGQDAETERFLSTSSTGRRVSFNEAALFEQSRKAQDKGRRYTLTEGDFHHLKNARLTHLHLPPLKIVTIHECDSGEASATATPHPTAAPKASLAIFQPPGKALTGRSVGPSSALPGDPYNSAVGPADFEISPSASSDSGEGTSLDAGARSAKPGGPGAAAGPGEAGPASGAGPVLQFFTRLRRHASLDGASPYFKVKKWKLEPSQRASSLDTRGGGPSILQTPGTGPWIQGFQTSTQGPCMCVLGGRWHQQLQPSLLMGAQRGQALGCLLPCGGGGGSHCQERRGEGMSSVGGQGRCVASDSASPLVGARLQLLWGGGRGQFWLKCSWPGRGGEGRARPTVPLGAQTEPVIREVDYRQMQAQKHPEPVCWVTVIPTPEAFPLRPPLWEGPGPGPAGLELAGEGVTSPPSPVPHSPPPSAFFGTLAGLCLLPGVQDKAVLWPHLPARATRTNAATLAPPVPPALAAGLSVLVFLPSAPWFPHLHGWVHAHLVQAGSVGSGVRGWGPRWEGPRQAAVPSSAQAPPSDTTSSGSGQPARAWSTRRGTPPTWTSSSTSPALATPWPSRAPAPSWPAPPAPPAPPARPPLSAG
ncbi:voltage-dependent calcium channel beta subunit-associated regulatory protein isoform X4 [Tursiops truncatus]